MNVVDFKRVGRSDRRRDRSFISDEPLRNVVLDSVQGVLIKVRLTSYRSLPLSCIEAIELKLDGVQVDAADLILRINYANHRLKDMPHLSGVWWFILDYADLFVPLARKLAPGYHEVEGTLVTVEPYMTAGRFSFHNSAHKRLAVEADEPAWWPI